MDNPSTLFNYLYSSLQANPTQNQGNVTSLQNAPSSPMNPTNANINGAPTDPVVAQMQNQNVNPGMQMMESQSPNTFLSLLNGKQSTNQNTQANTIADTAQGAAINGESSPQAEVGQVLDGHEQGGQYSGLCQQYVDDQTGATQRYPSAIATWDAKAKQGVAKQGLQGVQAGDVIEFAADSSNGGDGHAALVQSNPKNPSDPILNMASYSGITQMPMSQWLQYSGQQPLGYYSPTQSNG